MLLLQSIKILQQIILQKKECRAECIKLNGAVELAPKLKICSTIVDLVSTGKTLKENNLKESSLVMQITSKLIINKIAYKLMNDDITKILNKFKKVLNGKNFYLKIKKVFNENFKKI